MVNITKPVLVLAVFGLSTLDGIMLSTVMSLEQDKQYTVTRYEKNENEMKEGTREFESFGRFGQINPETMAQTQCTKICETVDSHAINLEKSEVSNSKTSISACSCGPDCGPDKCDGRNRSVLVGWDSLRSKIFVFLFIAFMVWLVVYVPISLTVLGK